MQYGRSQILLSLLALGLIGSALVFLPRQDSEGATVKGEWPVGQPKE